MNKKKSKCKNILFNPLARLYPDNNLKKGIWSNKNFIIWSGCCIYEKPKDFGESSSESDDECEHCHGKKDAHKKVLPSKKDEPPGDAIQPHPGKSNLNLFRDLLSIDKKYP